MNIEQFQIAVTKAGSPEAAEALRQMEPLFLAFIACQRSFAERIESSKRARGEAPMKLRKSKRQDLESLAQDAENIDREITEQLRSLSDLEIIGALRTGLNSDLSFWKSSLKHFHEAELPLGLEYVEIEERLIGAMDQFVATFGNGAG